MNHTLEILNRAKTLGVMLSVDENQLIVKVPKRVEIEKSFLENLKNNRESLIAYFNNGMTIPKNDISQNVVTSSCKVPWTHHWWLDPNKDMALKEKIFLLLKYKIAGKFDIGLLKKSLSFVIKRHESLRSVFRATGEDEYLMIVVDENSPKLQVDYRDFSHQPSTPENVISDVFNFCDHRFDLENGPLFLVRLLKTADDEYLLSCKLHHIVYDAWSVEILFRDLFYAFAAFSAGQEPALPPLKFHYKDFMASVNENYDRYRKRDEAYWEPLASVEVKDLIIPGQKERAVKQSVNACRTEIFPLPPAATEALIFFAGKYSSSLFLILQTVVKMYLHKITGNGDQIFSTMVFGRDLMEGSDDQIGHYCRMNIMRTIFDENESFDQCVAKVQKANEDMNFYTAETLLSVLRRTLESKNQPFDLLCRRIAIQYSDSNGYVNASALENLNTSADFQISFVPTTEKQDYTNFDLYLHFIKDKDGLDFHLLYSLDLFDLPSITTFAKGLFDFILSIPRPSITRS